MKKLLLLLTVFSQACINASDFGGDDVNGTPVQAQAAVPVLDEAAFHTPVQVVAVAELDEAAFHIPTPTIPAPGHNFQARFGLVAVANPDQPAAAAGIFAHMIEEEHLMQQAAEILAAAHGMPAQLDAGAFNSPEPAHNTDYSKLTRTEYNRASHAINKRKRSDSIISIDSDDSTESGSLIAGRYHVLGRVSDFMDAGNLMSNLNQETA